MALSDLFGGGGLLGGGGDPLDIYGDLFTKEQKAALQQRSMNEGLLRLAGAFGKAAQPSRMPTSFLGSLGEAAGAMAGTGDQATETALKAMKVGEDVRTSKQQREWTAKLLPSLVAKLTALEKANGLPQGSLTSQIPGTGAATAASPAGAPPVPGPGGGGPYAPPPPPPAAASPLGSGYLGPTNEELGAPPAPGDQGSQRGGSSATVAPGWQPNPALDSPPTAAERLEWRKTVGPGRPYLPIEDWVVQRRAGQKQTGLLPPQDQVVGPDGQPLQGPGILPTMNASYGGAPGGMPPFRLASSTPTESAPPGAAGGDEWLKRNATIPMQGGRAIPPNAYAQGYTYDQPKVPFGQDPGDYFPGQAPAGAKPGGGLPSRVASALPVAAGRDDPRGVVPYIRERATALGIDPDVAERVARSEGVSSFQSNVIQSSGRREPSYGAFQVYTGGGMGNDFQRDTGLDPADPKNEKATIDYALQKARTGGWTPFHGAKGAGISARAGIPGGEDYVIPSGRGIPASALRNVADTGAAPGGIPGGVSNMPEQLSTLSAITQLLGLKDPFHPMLETYYKSPGYLAEKARTEKQAESDVRLRMDPLIEEQNKRAAARVDLEYKPRIEEAVQKLQSPILKEREQAKADIERVSEELKQNRVAALTPTDATIAGPDGQPVDTKISAMDLVLKQKDRADRIAKGDMTIRPGDIIGKPALTPGETVTQQKSAEVPYTIKDVQLNWPDGTSRKVTLTGQQAKDAAEGKPVPAVGWPGTMSGGTIGEEVLPSGHAEATTVLLKDRRPKAEAAVQSLNFTETAKQLLDAGVFSGTGAGLRLDVAKAKSLLGWDDARIATTEAFIATQARQVASVLASGAYGSGSSITNEDRLQVANSVGQNTALDEKTLRFLVNTNETAANWEIDRYNKDVERHDPKNRLPILRVDRSPKAETPPMNKSASDKGPAVAARERAADAIAKGADRLIVIQRLKAAGISTEGL